MSPEPPMVSPVVSEWSREKISASVVVALRYSATKYSVGFTGDLNTTACCLPEPGAYSVWDPGCRSDSVSHPQS